MFLTIEKLRTQIQVAKKQLIASTAIWLESKVQMSQQDKLNWLKAANANTREEMQSILRQHEFPFEHFDTVSNQIPAENLEEDRINSVELVSVVSPPQEPLIVLRSNYVCTNNNNEVLSGLCHLTNLVEQLYLLEQLLDPIESYVHLNPLDLAHAMTESILNEWRFAEPGLQTVNCYTQRYQIAQQQYKYAQQKNLDAFKLLKEQLEFRTLQFEDTLSCFASSLGETYSSVKDNRFRLFLSLRPYLPWHVMLNQLAINLFETEGIIHSGLQSMNIKKSKLTEINGSFAAEHEKPIEQLEKKHLEKCTAIDQKLEIIKLKIESMSSSLEVKRQFGLRRNTALFLMPNQLFGFMNFFQAVRAVYQTSSENELSIQNRQALEAESIDNYQHRM